MHTFCNQRPERGNISIAQGNTLGFYASFTYTPCKGNSNISRAKKTHWALCCAGLQIHNRSISLANSSPENNHILQRTVTMVVIHRSLLDAINHIQSFDDLAKHSITAIQMGHTTIFYIVLLHH